MQFSHQPRALPVSTERRFHFTLGWSEPLKLDT
jgi:hypothetical protein